MAGCQRHTLPSKCSCRIMNHCTVIDRTNWLCHLFFVVSLVVVVEMLSGMPMFGVLVGHTALLLVCWMFVAQFVCCDLHSSALHDGTQSLILRICLLFRLANVACSPHSLLASLSPQSTGSVSLAIVDLFILIGIACLWLPQTNNAISLKAMHKP